MSVEELVEREREKEYEKNLKRRRYGRIVSLSFLLLFFAVGITAGYSLFNSETTEQLLILSAPIFGASLVGWFALSINRHFGCPIPNMVIGIVLIIVTSIVVTLLY